jgi:hypothetical protein
MRYGIASQVESGWRYEVEGGGDAVARYFSTGE